MTRNANSSGHDHHHDPNINIRRSLLLSLLWLVLLLKPTSSSSSSSSTTSFNNFQNSTTSNIHHIGGTLLTAASSTSPNRHISLGFLNGGSSFFDTVTNGFEQACRKYDINCYIAAFSSDYKNLTGPACPDFRHHTTRQWIESGIITGIAMKPCDERYNYIIQEATNVGIPVVTFDSDVVNSSRVAYVGTDQEFLGRTMARLLKQLKPEGGTFAIVGNKVGRDEAFIGEITKDNDRDDRAHWYPNTPAIPYTGGGLPTYWYQMNEYAKQNVTALINMKQTPQKHPNWTNFVDTYRDITYIGVDGADFQLAYLNQRYVDGLVGQLPWDIGHQTVQVLMEYIQNDGNLPQEIYPTNLVAYNLIPLELPELEIDQNLLEHWKWVGIVCFIIVAIAVLICIGWTLYYQTISMVVVAAQPFFLIMTAVGILIMAATLIPLSFDDKGYEPQEELPLPNSDDDATTTTIEDIQEEDDDNILSHSKRIGICMSIPWLAFTGFTVVFSALFSKTWRINRIIVQSAHFGRGRISEWDVLGPFAIILLCNVTVLTIWTIVDPLMYTREFDKGTDYWNREISSTGSCQCDNAAAYLVPLGLINFAIVAFACHQAIQARGIKSEFSESKYIGLAVFSMFQGFLTGIPIVAVVRDIPRAFYLVLTFVIFILCMVVLLLIFLPKILLQRRYASKSKADQKKLMTMAISVRNKSTNKLQQQQQQQSYTIGGSGSGGAVNGGGGYNKYDDNTNYNPAAMVYAAAARDVHNGSASEHMKLQQQDPHMKRLSDLDPHPSVSFHLPTTNSSFSKKLSSSANNKSSSCGNTNRIPPRMPSSSAVISGNDSQWSRPVVLSSNKTESTADPSVVSAGQSGAAPASLPVKLSHTDFQNDKQEEGEENNNTADSTTATTPPPAALEQQPSSCSSSSEEATLLFRQLMALTAKNNCCNRHNDDTDDDGSDDSSNILNGFLRLVDREALTESERQVLDDGLLLSKDVVIEA